MAVIVPKTVLAMVSSTPTTRCPAFREMRVWSDGAVAIVRGSVRPAAARHIVLSG
jgi:hypothetical protein